MKFYEKGRFHFGVLELSRGDKLAHFNTAGNYMAPMICVNVPAAHLFDIT